MPDGVGEPEAAAPEKRTATLAPPSSLAEVNFDDLLPPEPEAESEYQTPTFPVPPSMAEVNFDTASQAAAAPPAPPQPAQPVAAASGLGISFSGGPAAQPAGPTPAQVAANSQSLRIRLLRPDGKPFDGPEITTGPKDSDAANGGARSGFDAAQRGPKKQAPKVVVKAGPMARLGHALAVLGISALGIVPLAYLLLQSVHDREDKLAAKITVPTKMNVLDGTSDAYLAGMAVVLLVVALVYWTRLKRRRAR